MPIFLLLIALAAFPQLVLLGESRTYHENKRAAEYERDTQTAPPSILGLFFIRGTKNYASYCAQKPESEPDKWLQKFSCNVSAGDAYVALFTALLVLVTGGLIYIEYTDIYGQRWRFRFAYRHRGANSFVYHEEHNDERPA